MKSIKSVLINFKQCYKDVMKTKREFSEYEKMRARMVLENCRGLKLAEKAMMLYRKSSYAFNLNITNAKELVRQSNSL